MKATCPWVEVLLLLNSVAVELVYRYVRILTNTRVSFWEVRTVPIKLWFDTIICGVKTLLVRSVSFMAGVVARLGILRLVWMRLLNAAWVRLNTLWSLFLLNLEICLSL
jgi:hypothetical protein